MSEYASAITLARRLIEKKGREIEFTCQSDTRPDPDKPWEVEKGWTETQKAKAVQVKLETKYIDGESVLQSDKELIVAAASLEGKITTEHILVDHGYNHRIVKIDPLQPGPECVMFVLIVR